jgi:hypothetical protein
MIMKKNIKSISLTTFLGMAIVFAACDKKDDSAGTVTPEKVAQMQQIAKMNNAFHNFFGGAVQNQSNARREAQTGRSANSCPGFTLNLDSAGGWGIRVTFDYGNGCPDDIAAGIIRKGKVEYGYFFSNNLVSSISSRYMQYQDALNTYNGLLRLSHNSIPTGSNWVLTANNFSVNNISLGNTNYNGAFTHKQIQGGATPFVYTDDVNEISGSSNAVNNLTGNSEYTILQPLIHKGNCNYIVAGKAKIRFNNLEGVLDYGNGNCDKQGTLTINGVSYPVTF